MHRLPLGKRVGDRFYLFDLNTLHQPQSLANTLPCKLLGILALQPTIACWKRALVTSAKYMQKLRTWSGPTIGPVQRPRVGKMHLLAVHEPWDDQDLQLRCQWQVGEG